MLSLSLLLVAQALDPGVENDLTLTRILNGLDAPTAAQFLPDGRMVILQQNGQFKVYTGTLPLIDAGTLTVDTSHPERGLLGLAVDPEFATSNRLYFYYSADGVNANDRNRVAWTTIDPSTSIVDVAGRTDILTGIYGPANHDGGGLAFGPDGHLYIGTGDTGCNCECDPGTNTRNFFPTCLTNLNGKILRIDRNGGIPASNPLVNVAQVKACGPQAACGNMGAGRAPSDQNMGAPRTEIYAWGLRNPWRFSFDSETGFLWIGDVGDKTFEEITVSKRPGEHHGWPYREGAAGQEVTTCAGTTPESGNCVDPVYALPANESPGNRGSITGGVFSSHCSWPQAWRGRYWFGDYAKNRIWTFNLNGKRDNVELASRTLIVQRAVGPAHFFNAPDGSIYFIAIEGSSIWRLAPTNPVVCTGEDDAGVVTHPDATTPAGDTGVVSPVIDSGVIAPAADAGANTGGGRDEDDGCGCTIPARHRTPVAATFCAIAVLAALLYSRRPRR
jgi:glucose/arabinose dehydrogenase